MSCPNKYQKSSLRAYNSTEQNFATSGNIVFSNIGYESGTSINFDANSDTIYLKGNGLYYITLDVVMANGTAATDTNVQLYQDGSIITGASASATLATTISLEDGTISAIVGVSGCPCQCNKGSAITFKVSGTSALIESANLNIVKLA